MAFRLARIAWGNAGIEQTIALMWRYILGWDPDRPMYETIPRLRAQAIAILRERGVLRASDDLQAAALYEWVQERVAYLRDPLLLEHVTAPLKLLDDIAHEGEAAEDCESYVVLMGALFAVVGLPFHIVAVSWRPDQEWVHVFYVVHTTSGLYAADAIPIDGELMPFGWHLPGYDPDTGEIAPPVTAAKEFPAPTSYEALGVNPLAGSVAR